MSRLRWPHGLAVLVVVVAVAASAGPVAASLPDGRAYELVSPLDVNHNKVSGAKMAPDGERVALLYQGGMQGTSTGGTSLLLSERTESGWQTRSILPERQDLLDTAYGPVATSADLTEFIILAFHSFPDILPPVRVVRLNADRSQTLLHTFNDGSVNTTQVATSADMRRVLLNVLQSIEPGHVVGTRNVYDFGSGSPTLVSRMPDGSVPACGTLSSGIQAFYPSFAAPEQHWVSVDGKRAFFHSRGSSCGGPIDLYMRDLDAGTTTLLSAPVSGTNGGSVFLRASADGSQVYQATTSRLDLLDSNTTRDIYRYTVGSGNVCLTCVGATAANVRPIVSGEFPVVTEDGSMVYFTTTSVLTGDDVEGAGRSAYVLENGVFTYVAPTNVIHYNGGNSGQVTPDGRVLVFRTNRSELNALTGSNNGGTNQYYRYDHGDGSLVCISCPDGSVPTDGVPAGMSFFSFGVDNPRIMSDDGSLIVFTTSEALVPEDVNEQDDTYRWLNGDVALVTDGVTTYSEFLGSTATGSQPVGVTSDGSDIFFKDFSALTPELAGNDQPPSQIYDARVGGGFPVAPAPPAPCADDQCQGLPSAAPSLAGIGSALESSGNLVEPTPRVTLARVSRAQRAAFARRGSVRIRATANVDGELRAVARARIGARMRTVASARTAMLAEDRSVVTLRLSRAARAALAGNGSLRVVVSVQLSGAPSAQRTALVLKLPATANGR